jgi:ribonuclease P/MRP protein subunit POP1
MPQYINIQKFLECRSYELKHFNTVLNTKLTSKLEHQLLPRHMRRRAMAHNYYRIPLRIRFKSLLELSPSEPEVLPRSKCRKHRRKLRFLLNHYERRQREFKWMETHIWHAKRF